MKKTYKTDYILKNYTPGEIQKLAGVPAFVTARMQRGEIEPKGRTSALLKYFYNREKNAELKAAGMPLDTRRYHIRNFEESGINKEKNNFDRVANIIWKNKVKKNPQVTLEHIKNGMSKSFRETSGDWKQYIKEKKYVSASAADKLIQ